MGYGEFGGGGSVKWKVRHNKGNEKPGGHDKDVPKGSEGGVFWVRLPDGEVKGPYPIDDTNPRQIVVTWTPDTIDTIDESAT